MGIVTRQIDSRYQAGIPGVGHIDNGSAMRRRNMPDVGIVPLDLDLPPAGNIQPGNSFYIMQLNPNTVYYNTS